jgi:metal-responsive CopG/Arc/MetJ family transcriptional regulator
MAETQVLFRVEEELLEALDRILPARGFKTRNEWFRAQIRDVLEEETRRKRVMGILDRLTAEGIEDKDIVRMVKDWRSRGTRR